MQIKFPETKLIMAVYRHIQPILPVSNPCLYGPERRII